MPKSLAIPMTQHRPSACACRLRVALCACMATCSRRRTVRFFGPSQLVANEIPLMSAIPQIGVLLTAHARQRQLTLQ